MNKKEVAEIKRRFKKDACTFTKMTGCYVDASKEKVVKFNETFLNLEDEEFHKYLEIANKSLSGTVGNNLIELNFPSAEEEVGGRQQILMALRETKLQDENILDTFYDLVIDTYDYVGNYLILLFHDAYDVMVRTSDNNALDESEEVYEYIICAICPVALSKPGLGYREDEHRIGPRIRDWVVGATDTAFTFPCFTDRSTDIHSVLCYTKNAKEPHKEYWENGLGCGSKRTATEKKEAFNNIMIQTFGPDDEETEDKVLDVQQGLNDYILDAKETHEKDEPIILKSEDVVEILEESGVSEEKANKISKHYEEFFEDALPTADELLDTKALKNNEARVEKKVLQEKVVDLTHQLEDAGVITKDGEEVEVVLKVKPEKVPLITSTFVDGKKCLVIPLEEDEQARINGEMKSL